jgi:acetolactate synthase small subunit
MPLFYQEGGTFERGLLMLFISIRRITQAQEIGNITIIILMKMTDIDTASG